MKAPFTSLVRRFAPVRSLVRAALAAFVLCGVALAIAVRLEPLPAALANRDVEPSVRVFDRNGVLIREVRRSDGAFASDVRLAALPNYVVPALIAAEDARFEKHPGVDPLAIGRALVSAIWQRRIVSGASTITQQLARTVKPHPKTFRGKLGEIVTALSIERALDKSRILEEYLTRVEFGPNIRGIDAASRAFFDKPASKLSLAEAALLVSIPRGPTLYDPRRGIARVWRRRDRVLERMRSHRLASDAEIARARAEPIVLRGPSRASSAHHFTRSVLRSTRLLESQSRRRAELVTTLDLSLQREVEALTRQTAERLRPFDASAAAVVVIDNETGDVLAYVGSPDFFSESAEGQNDGVEALRQPGSALKPFVYAAALEQGFTPATVLPDIEQHFPTAAGDYSPKNYDGRYHGPVRLREALASSLNVPAVYVADRLGPATILKTLHRVGFASLRKSPDEYGAAIALGDGEVRLAELAAAYSALARGGRYRPLRTVREARFGNGERAVFAPSPVTLALAPRAARQITSILSDDHARASSFGLASVLAFDYPVAAKTGTSKGFRDNWAVGYTRERTVAVWVGNFDGHPLRGSSGVTGAGPLFHAAMEAAMRGLSKAPLLVEADDVEVELCSLSGQLPTKECVQRVRERFAPGQAPTAACAMHVRVELGPIHSLRAVSGVSSRVFESYPAAYASWAARVHRPLAPGRTTGILAGSSPAEALDAPEVAYPPNGATFYIDPSVAASQQQIVLSARSRSAAIVFVLDGHSLAARENHRLAWPLRRGTHELYVRSQRGVVSRSVVFVVR